MTVVTTKQEYLTKMQELLNDDNTYHRLDDDPTQKLQRKNNKIISTMENKHYINKLKRKQLSTDTATAPRLYGLPKIHKENNPMRPVVSNINSPGYHLSKYICTLLQKANFGKKHSIKNTDEFKQFISNVSLNPNDVLISLDVESLYTNVDMEIVFKIIDKNWQSIDNITPIDKDLFLEIITFCVIECNYFTFDQNFYKQKYGLAMGNPLSGILAEMVLDHIIDEALQKTTVDMTFLKRYVDDIICAIPNGKQQNIKTIFNNIHPRFKFTIEEESEKGIPFLDMRLIRTNNHKIITDWYCKPCSSNRILNFFSNHPHNTKIKTAQAFTNNIIKISDIRFLRNNIKIINNILKKNNYPHNIIDSVIKRATRNRNYNNETRRSEQTPRLEKTSSIYKSIPFIDKLSHKIANIIKKDNNHIKIAFKPINKLEKCYTKTKDPIENKEKNSVIYKVKCEDCDKFYIGQTSKKLKTRLSQHKTYINKQTPRSTLATHTLDTGHKFSFDETKILDIENSKRKRETKEACYIHINKNKTVNLRRDTDQINHEYKYILRKIKPQ